MSRLAEYRRLEQQLAQQLAELEAMKSDGAIQAEMDFENKLRALLGEYGFSLREVIGILDPHAHGRHQTPAAVEKSSRKPREVKVYKNPHNGELVQTKGGNHAVLKAWKAEHGSEVVESWRQ
ncbi:MULTISPECIES: histone-like nucleoid-structuring protein, MvaT/MvaU family [Pseudomonas]|uniref:Transcriptional regulator TurD n=1 Tax=Pseudomonas putida NBRC 14164 TaxID=1211579 RepID=A0ABM7ELD1_PSEPU|nr:MULTISPECIES: histone-like nucleoid-structuring protein, MvaT/MvaU family [Pseudomonas]MCX9137587.1 DNA binding protein [Pseudomonas sp. DCB_PUT]MDD1969948.1 DNA binding protein [Pseudomonas putida]MDO1461814.1 H-NS histone family protein [Pseudomonas putida]MDO1467191.1 H-NS histone family protein [Pseudomonas putida]MDZ7329002.1 H-NS histone family protein [Pseudomonas sp. SDS3-8]